MLIVDVVIALNLQICNTRHWLSNLSKCAYAPYSYSFCFQGRWRFLHILYVYVGHEYARIITAYDDRWQHTTIIISLIIHNPSFQMMFATFTIEADGFVACQQHLKCNASVGNLV